MLQNIIFAIKKCKSIFIDKVKGQKFGYIKHMHARIFILTFSAVLNICLAEVP